MKNRKLFIVSASYPFGKQEVFLDNEVWYLSKFFDITLIPAYFYNNDKFIRLLPNNVEYLSPYISNGFFENLTVLFSLDFLNIRFKEFVNIIFSFKLSFFKEFFVSSRNIILFKKSKGILKIQDNPDAIVYFYWANSAILLSKYLKNEIFVRVHGGEFNSYYTNGYVPYAKLRASINCKFLPISNDASNKLRFFNKKADFIISRLGVSNDFKVAKKFNSIITVVSCSSVIKLKRLDLIIDSLSLVHREIKWYHFGDGPLMRNFINYASLKLRGNVKVSWMGRVSNDQLFDFYKNNDVHLFINLSDTEGIPVSIMEAFSFGIPALVRNIGGLSEIVKNSNGWILDDPVDIKLISSIIDDLSEMDFYRLSFGAHSTWDIYYKSEVNYSNICKLFSSTQNFLL